MIGWILTLIGGGALGWVLRGKAEKKGPYTGSGSDKEEE